MAETNLDVDPRYVELFLEVQKIFSGDHRHVSPASHVSVPWDVIEENDLDGNMLCMRYFSFCHELLKCRDDSGRGYRDILEKAVGAMEARELIKVIEWPRTTSVEQMVTDMDGNPLPDSVSTVRLRYVFDMPALSEMKRPATIGDDGDGENDESGGPKAAIAIPEAGHFSATQLAEMIGLNPSNLAKRLERMRVKKRSGFIENENRRQNEPQYLYDVTDADVREILTDPDLKMSDGPSDENFS